MANSVLQLSSLQYYRFMLMMENLLGKMYIRGHTHLWANLMLNIASNMQNIDKYQIDWEFRSATCWALFVFVIKSYMYRIIEKNHQGIGFTWSAWRLFRRLVPFDMLSHIFRNPSQIIIIVIAIIIAKLEQKINLCTILLHSQVHIL